MYRVGLERSLHSLGQAAKTKLSTSAIHVWEFALDDLSRQTAQLRTVLDSDELARAGRFHFQEHRDHFIATHGLLRMVLAQYVNLSPVKIRYDYNAHGKPTLGSQIKSADLRFNLSHSRNVALLALARAREVGIDIEYCRTDFDYETLANRFFSANEVEELFALPSHLRHKAFFLCWTRKEAYIKARGEGLSRPLREFDVTLSPEVPAKLLQTRWDVNDAKRWSLVNLDVRPQYAAAVAVEGQDYQLSRWRITD